MIKNAIKTRSNIAKIYPVLKLSTFISEVTKNFISEKVSTYIVLTFYFTYCIWRF